MEALGLLFAIKGAALTTTAVLIDGGFYRKKARSLWGDKSPKSRAEELTRYVFKHLDKKDGDKRRELYRIFYYDCPPLEKILFHPLKRKNVDFRKRWTDKFFDELRSRRKFALRLGRLSDTSDGYQITIDALKRLCAKRITVEDLTESDFRVTFKQKGVDMKLGLDISSLAYGGIVDQIILISGDSDFVPAAKIARRKGIDFILDPMGNSIAPDLNEHVDGIESFLRKDPYGHKSDRQHSCRREEDRW